MQKLIGSWRSGKFLPLIQRPFSVNTYAMSKVWYRTSCVNLRESDFLAINSSIKKWIYADLLFKPEEIVLFRKVKEGGLGLVSCKFKSLSFRIKTFLELAADQSYIGSLFSNTLYRAYILDEDIEALPIPPYYDAEFFAVIKDALNNGQDIISMSVKQWYNYLLEQNITTITNNEGRMLRPCRVERMHVDVAWEAVWANVRHPALSNQTKSFVWKFIHDLLPSEVRLHAASLNDPYCRFSCAGNPVGDLEHCFFRCTLIAEVGSWLLNVHEKVNPGSTPSLIMRLDSQANYGLLLLTIKAFEYCWLKRSVGRDGILVEFLSSLERDLKVLDMTRYRPVGEEVRQLAIL